MTCRGFYGLRVIFEVDSDPAILILASMEDLLLKRRLGNWATRLQIENIPSMAVFTCLNISKIISTTPSRV
jgi:hypothetical protein